MSAVQTPRREHPKMKRTIVKGALVVVAVGLIVWSGLILLSAKQKRQRKIDNLTESFQVLSVQEADHGLVLQLKNGSNKLITAYSLSLGPNDMMETDFVPGLGRQGVAPGETESITIPLVGQGPPTITIGAIVFEDGSSEGDFEAADDIRDRRIGDRIQLQRIQALIAKASPEPDAIKELKRQISSLSDVPPYKNHSQGIRSGMNFAKDWTLKMLERLEAGELDDQLKTAKGYNERIVLPNGKLQVGLEMISGQVAR